ncbi:MAG: DUF1080 domain-containing protein [Clostridiales bacterium]|nr:DUF1080 domain-containing protein [Clostridiales bacterium]
MRTKKLSTVLLSVVMCVCFLMAGLGLLNKTEVVKGLEIEGAANEFSFTEETISDGQSFVFSATFNFISGQAVGLAFGGVENESCFVFNMDRFENRVKLMYFEFDGMGGSTDVVLLTDYFIGNDKMTVSENNLVAPKVREIPWVQLKIILSCEEEETIVEFYVDNIRRFGVDRVIKMEDFSQTATYNGGTLGFNCFNAKAGITDVYTGETDYSYYTELYRQQYHFSQYRSWNNDPNGLVYYDGYYHLYYQHHPYSNYWSDMYWGHARSTDLFHWELLPICLFPDADWSTGNGYMWSGSAMVYHKGVSADIDGLNWYPNGNGDGLLAFYTRDGGYQDQIIMSSDDGGMTWTKRRLISQLLIPDYTTKTDCRDPKVFPIKKDGDKVTMWGMALTGLATNNLWFLKSSNLLDWSYAGGFKAESPECPDVVTLKADDETEHTVITFTGRRYLVGELTYDEDSGNIIYKDLNGNNFADMQMSDIPFQTMDYGKDSYATQSYYIDDTSSTYYGKTVSVSWFSGVPNHPDSIESGLLAALRKVWNGGGFTIPVEWGLKKSDSGYLLTQTPIVKDTTALDKTSVYTATNKAVDETENILSQVSGRRLEINATITNANKESLAFRVGVSDSEYTEIGWNQTDGYYVDRTYTSDGGLTIPAYRVKYTSGATASNVQTFYILVDDGGVEVFCDDFTIPFYVLTFISPYSTGLSFTASGDVTVNSLQINEIATVWREDNDSNETVLHLDKDSVELDLSLTTSQTVVAYSTTDIAKQWEVEQGSDIVEVTPTESGAIITAKKSGTAVVKVTCGNAVKRVNVKVYGGSKDFDLTFSKQGVKSGQWLMTSNGLIGKSSSGDAFILSNESASNFNYVVKFDLSSGTAAAVMFRAKEDMTDYYVVTFDKNENVIKLWTKSGVLLSSHVTVADLSAIVIGVKAQGNNFIISLNGKEVMNYTDTREGVPTQGQFGLNVFNANVTFSDVALVSSEYTFNGNDLSVKMDVKQYVNAIYNVSLGNALVPVDFYTVTDKTVKISSRYFSLLPATGLYEFKIEGSASLNEVKITVNNIPEISINDLSIKVNENAVFFIGNTAVSQVTVNGRQLETNEYKVKDYMLTIYASALSEGENIVAVGDGLSAKVTVSPANTESLKSSGCGSNFNVANISLIILALGVAFGIKILRKER